MDVSFFSSMSLDLSTSPSLYRMRTHSGPSYWVRPEPEHTWAKQKFTTLHLGPLLITNVTEDPTTKTDQAAWSEGADILDMEGYLGQ
jgi:hypothetical protein